jgi:sugar phosphate isomerase/epimerase
MADVSKPRVILTGFADEAVPDNNFKSVEQQLSVFSGLGLRHFTPRFVNFGGEGEKNRNVVTLSDEEVGRLGELIDKYSMSVSSVGSPYGKVKLLDMSDDSTNSFIAKDEYLDRVARGIAITKALGSRLIRGFSGYPPLVKFRTPAQQRLVFDSYLGAAVEFLGPIVEMCEREGVLFGLEVEANLAGYDGKSLAEIKRQIRSPNLVLVYDGANVLVQGLDPVKAYHDMKEGIGWFHIKDYMQPGQGPVEWKGIVDEEMLQHFVPADEGQVGHPEIFRDFRGRIPALKRRLARHGVTGVYLDLEPHVKGGGQFGGYSGPDGMRRALDGLRRVLDGADIGYTLRA